MLARRLINIYSNLIIVVIKAVPAALVHFAVMSRVVPLGALCLDHDLGAAHDAGHVLGRCQDALVAVVVDEGLAVVVGGGVALGCPSDTRRVSHLAVHRVELVARVAVARLVAGPGRCRLFLHFLPEETHEGNGRGHDYDGELGSGPDQEGGGFDWDGSFSDFQLTAMVGF